MIPTGFQSPLWVRDLELSLFQCGPTIIQVC